jgi:hypothetical protein
MNAFFFTSASGWFAVILICIATVIPYATRRNWLNRTHATQPNSTPPFLTRLRAHYWIGYVVTALSFAHAWGPMRSGYMKRTDLTGLWFATVALLLLFLQILVGLTLRAPQLPARRSLRSLHFWGMAAIVALAGAHIWRNAR